MVARRTKVKLISKREAQTIAWDAMLDYLIGAARYGNTTPKAGYLLRIGENAIKDANKKAARRYIRELRAEWARPFEPDFAPALVAEVYLRQVIDFLDEGDLRLARLLDKHNGNQAAVARAMGMSKFQVNRQVKALREKLLGKFPDLLDSWPSDRQHDRPTRRKTSERMTSLDGTLMW
jgi:hypothetical protein